jgi:IclR-like helix-turn-helix domain-containing protein
VPNASRTFPDDPYGPDEVVESPHEFWPGIAVVPFHYPHPPSRHPIPSPMGAPMLRGKNTGQAATTVNRRCPHTTSGGGDILSVQKSGSQILQSAEHALRLVQLITARGSMGLTEVTVELRVGPSTAHRLLATCGHAGFVRQDRPGGRYLVGPAIHELMLAVTAAVSLRDAASPYCTNCAPRSAKRSA